MGIRFTIRKKLSRAFTLEAECVTDGGTLGILGPSGAGKSMTLKCIAGLETPDEGVIIAGGRVLFDSAAKINLKAQERRAGYLFQHYALFPRMTAAQNIGAALRIQWGGEGGVNNNWGGGLLHTLKTAHRLKKEKTEALIKQFALCGHEHKYPRELSGGQQQRCALARLMAASPALLLLDEPFSALDAELRGRMQNETLRLLKTFTDAVLVTHSRDEAYTLSDRLVVMDEGRIIRVDTPKELFARPETERAAVLTGCKNISPVTRKGSHEVYAVDWGITLRTAEAVGDDITHIGIRAHDFIAPPLDTGADGGLDGKNRISINVNLCIDEPFEETVLFTAKNAASCAELCWKRSRTSAGLLPKTLYVPPERILLLKG
jgi:molybdate transport system ATP-binding protein